MESGRELGCSAYDPWNLLGNAIVGSAVHAVLPFFAKSLSEGCAAFTFA